MKCSRCGTDNPEGKSVCLKCGNFLYSSTPRNRVAMTPEQKRKRRQAMLKSGGKGCLSSVLLLVGMLILMVIISFILMYFFGKMA